MEKSLSTGSISFQLFRLELTVKSSLMTCNRAMHFLDTFYTNSLLQINAHGNTKFEVTWVVLVCGVLVFFFCSDLKKVLRHVETSY